MSGLEEIDCIYVINLDERPEKWQRMQWLFEAMQLKGNRVSAINGWKIPQATQKELAGIYPLRLTGGHLGCLLSHISVVRDAYERGFDTVWIMEDDVDFKEDPQIIPILLKQLQEIDPDWDVFYTDIDSKNSKGERVESFASAFHPGDDRPLEQLILRTQVTSDIMKLGQRFGLYSYIVSRKGLEKILHYFTHIYLWTHVDIDIHYVPGIREYSATREIASIWYECTISDTVQVP